jgi:hypothetical protein
MIESYIISKESKTMHPIQKQLVQKSYETHNSSTFRFDLPSDLILKIFDLLKEKDIFNMVLVNSHWKFKVINEYKQREFSLWSDCLTFFQKDLLHKREYAATEYETYRIPCKGNSLPLIRNFYNSFIYQLCKTRNGNLCISKNLTSKNKYVTLIASIIYNFRNVKSSIRTPQGYSNFIVQEQIEIAQKLINSKMYNEVLFQVAQAISPENIAGIAMTIFIKAPFLYDLMIDIVSARRFSGYEWRVGLEQKAIPLKPQDAALVYIIQDMWCNELEGERLKFVIKLCNLLSDQEYKTHYLKKLHKQHKKNSNCSLL